MQKLFVFLFIFTICAIPVKSKVLSSNLLLSDSTKHAFVGAETCGMCHKTKVQGEQIVIWKTTQHSKAYETLKTPRADSIATTLGITKKAVECEKCLKCHVSGYNVDKALIKGKFKIEDGVQCETCHGAGNDYKSITVMKDVKLAVANGLRLPDSENREAFCTRCHNSESPTFVKFDYKAQWDKIKHYIPKK